MKYLLRAAKFLISMFTLTIERLSGEHDILKVTSVKKTVRSDSDSSTSLQFVQIVISNEYPTMTSLTIKISEGYFTWMPLIPMKSND